MISPGTPPGTAGARSWRGVLLVVAMFAFGGLALAGLFIARRTVSSAPRSDVELPPTTNPSQ